MAAWYQARRRVVSAVMKLLDHFAPTSYIAKAYLSPRDVSAKHASMLEAVGYSIMFDKTTKWLERWDHGSYTSIFDDASQDDLLRKEDRLLLVVALYNNAASSLSPQLDDNEWAITALEPNFA